MKRTFSTKSLLILFYLFYIFATEEDRSKRKRKQYSPKKIQIVEDDLSAKKSFEFTENKQSEQALYGILDLTQKCTEDKSIEKTNLPPQTDNTDTTDIQIIKNASSDINISQNSEKPESLSATVTLQDLIKSIRESNGSIEISPESAFLLFDLDLNSFPTESGLIAKTLFFFLIFQKDSELLLLSEHRKKYLQSRNFSDGTINLSDFSTQNESSATQSFAVGKSEQNSNQKSKLNLRELGIENYFNLKLDNLKNFVKRSFLILCGNTQLYDSTKDRKLPIFLQNYPVIPTLSFKFDILEIYLPFHDESVSNHQSIINMVAIQKFSQVIVNLNHDIFIQPLLAVVCYIDLVNSFLLELHKLTNITFKYHAFECHLTIQNQVKCRVNTSKQISPLEFSTLIGFCNRFHLLREFYSQKAAQSNSITEPRCLYFVIYNFCNDITVLLSYIESSSNIFYEHQSVDKIMVKKQLIDVIKETNSNQLLSYVPSTSVTIPYLQHYSLFYKEKFVVVYNWKSRGLNSTMGVILNGYLLLTHKFYCFSYCNDEDSDFIRILLDHKFDPIGELMDSTAAKPFELTMSAHKLQAQFFHSLWIKELDKQQATPPRPVNQMLSLKYNYFENKDSLEFNYAKVAVKYPFFFNLRCLTFKNCALESSREGNFISSSSVDRNKSLQFIQLGHSVQNTLESSTLNIENCTIDYPLTIHCTFSTICIKNVICKEYIKLPEIVEKIYVSSDYGLKCVISEIGLVLGKKEHAVNESSHFILSNGIFIFNCVLFANISKFNIPESEICIQNSKFILSVQSNDLILTKANSQTDPLPTFHMNIIKKVFISKCQGAIKIINFKKMPELILDLKEESEVAVLKTVIGFKNVDFYHDGTLYSNFSGREVDILNAIHQQKFEINDDELRSGENRDPFATLKSLLT